MAACVETLAKDCWPAFRAVCRSILVKYAQASKSGNESQKHRFMVELLNVPSQALLIRNGNVKRSNSQVNQALRGILQRKWLAESEVTAVARSIPPSDPTSYKIKKAIALVKAGHISRATKSLFQGNFLPISPTVITQLQQLHPPKDEKCKMPELPDSIPTIDVDVSKLIKLIDTKLKNGSAPGPSGWTGELLGSLVGDSECCQGLAALMEDMINGNVDAQARSISQRAACSL